LRDCIIKDTSDAKNQTIPENVIYCSQSSDTDVSDPAFKKLKLDYKLEGAHSPFKELTIAWIKKKAGSRRLTGRRIPFLCVSVQSVDCSSRETFLTLKDSTGEIGGVVHSEAWKLKGDKLVVGSAIALREVRIRPGYLYYFW